MSIEDILQRAKLAAAQLEARLGAVDHPAVPLFDVLGLPVYPGQNLVDTVTGEVVEVVNGGVQTVNPESAGP